ncbi:COR domain-containing protein [Bernardetia sp. OM2101]|uniref:COR domain-containing protein n=1 Tax=Bernardetia sp. OM2101 TaxID=3344876 RepID=UPI0035D09BF1
MSNYLALGSNQILSISVKLINRFPNLHRLWLYDNPIQNIPKEIFNKKYEDVFKPVKDYLEGIEKAKQINNEVKIILIGNGSVGKTQVATRLEQGEKFEFNKKHDSTHAISLLKKNIECEFLEEGLNLTIWDFGGQDIYHSTHRLFMKTRAVFLLVWDIENEVNKFHVVKDSEGKILKDSKGNDIKFKNEELNYWLSYISYFAKNSPILVVQNKIDEFEKRGEIAPPYDELAQNELKKQFPIIDFLQLSAKNGNGFEILENSIAEVFEDNEELKRELLLPLPAHWIAVRDRVRQEQQNPNGKKRISFQNFVEWCKEEDAENEADTLANFFHDTGVFYYQAKYFSGEIIINQSWAIEAVYKVLDKQSSYYGLLKQKKGILDYKIIKKVWSENSDEERELFIDYMLSTELCFKNTDNKKWDTTFIERSFLIPQLLPSKSKEEVLGYIELFELKPSEPKEYSFLPTSVIQRFMIKAKDFSSVELMWQTGLFVEYKESKVIVEAVYEKKQHHILIYHNSAAKNDLVEVILEELDKLDDENSSRNLDRNKLHLGEKSLQRGFEKLQKHKKDSQPLIHPIMSEKIQELKNKVEEGSFQEIFDYLDIHFKKEPYHQYSNLKQEILYQMKAGFPPRPMQLQAFKMFLNDDKVIAAIPKIEDLIRQNETKLSQKTTTTMYGADKEIEGIKKVIDLILEKKTFFLEAKLIAESAKEKFALKKQLEEIEEELSIYYQKIQKLQDKYPNEEKVESLHDTIQKMLLEYKEELNKLRVEVEQLKNTNNSKSKNMSMQTIKIFLASSSELKEDRRELREFFSIENDRMHEKGTYFKLIQWEHFLDTISDTRLQDEYNKALQDCDLVVGLFFTKAGKYTEEELEKAYQHFKEMGKPKILTYFKNDAINTNDITEEVLSLLKMKKNLADKGHFYTSYKNIEGLKNHLKSQLEKLGYYD